MFHSNQCIQEIRNVLQEQNTMSVLSNQIPSTPPSRTSTEDFFNSPKAVRTPSNPVVTSSLDFSSNDISMDLEDVVKAKYDKAIYDQSIIMDYMNASTNDIFDVATDFVSKFYDTAATSPEKPDIRNSSISEDDAIQAMLNEYRTLETKISQSDKKHSSTPKQYRSNLTTPDNSTKIKKVKHPNEYNILNNQRLVSSTVNLSSRIKILADTMPNSKSTDVTVVLYMKEVEDIVEIMIERVKFAFSESGGIPYLVKEQFDRLDMLLHDLIMNLDRHEFTQRLLQWRRSLSLVLHNKVSNTPSRDNSYQVTPDPTERKQRRSTAKSTSPKKKKNRSTSSSTLSEKENATFIHDLRKMMSATREHYVSMIKAQLKTNTGSAINAQDIDLFKYAQDLLDEPSDEEIDNPSRSTAQSILTASPDFHNTSPDRIRTEPPAISPILQHPRTPEKIILEEETKIFNAATSPIHRTSSLIVEVETIRMSPPKTAEPPSDTETVESPIPNYKTSSPVKTLKSSGERMDNVLESEKNEIIDWVKKKIAVDDARLARMSPPRKSDVLFDHSYHSPPRLREPLPTKSVTLKENISTPELKNLSTGSTSPTEVRTITLDKVYVRHSPPQKIQDDEIAYEEVTTKETIVTNTSFNHEETKHETANLVDEVEHTSESEYSEEEQFEYVTNWQSIMESAQWKAELIDLVSFTRAEYELEQEMGLNQPDS
jgi:hypothetical protein